MQRFSLYLLLHSPMQNAASQAQSQAERRKILTEYRNLLKAIRPQMQKGDKRLIRLAFEIALDAHKDMRRKSGEPYILHPLAVAQIVASEIGLGPTGVICALLHDVVEDTEITLEDVERDFGKKIREIIDGLTKISVIFDVQGYVQAENIRKILLTLAKDVRVILIKLADRLHNMRTMDSMPRNKQIKISHETTYLYVPLAHRLGLYNIKSELEDLAMKYTEPRVFKQIADKLAESKKERNQYINQFIKPIREELVNQHFEALIFGRPKSISSIWRKMKEQNIPFEKVMDKFAIRIIVKTIPEAEKAECWRAYSVISDIYRPNPDRLRDWISTPKSNGYEALHTTVMGPSGRWVEVQIRSERMNEIAEKGYAAHYKYKEKDNTETALDDWLRQIRELLENPETNTLDFIDDFKLNLFADEIYVFTPTGELKILPAGSTVLDFAYEIHSDLGNHCLGAKINHRIVSSSHQLSNGDQIEVLSSRKQHPNEEWLQFVSSAKAKSKIKEHLKEERRRIITIGKKSLENIFKEKNISFSQHNLGVVLGFFKLTQANDLYYSVGVGNFRYDDMNNFTQVGDQIELKNQEVKEDANLERVVKNKLIHDTNLFVFGPGEEDVAYNLAECCKPIPGDDVFGFVNKNHNIEIHKIDCVRAMNAIAKYGFRIVKTKWNKHQQIAFLTGLHIKGIDDVGVMMKIAGVISGELNINMQSISIDSKEGIFEGVIKVFVRDTHHLTLLMDKLLSLDGILEVTRIEEGSPVA